MPDVLTKADIEHAIASLDKPHKSMYVLMPRWFADAYMRAYGALPAGVVVADRLPDFPEDL